MDFQVTNMHFVFVSTMGGTPWGGSEELWSQAALHLRAQGHRVSASTIYWPQSLPQLANLRRQGIDLFPRKSLAHRSLAARIYKKIGRGLKWKPQELKWLAQWQPDLVVISQGGHCDGLEWMNFCHQANVPFATVVQCNHEGIWPTNELVDATVKAYQAARKVFCVSRHNLELLECQLGEALANAAVVWNPYNVPLDQPPAWPEEKVWKLACVARLEPSAKGQDLLFRVLDLPQWRGRPVEVNLYGRGDYEQALRRLADKFRLKNVVFRGHVFDIRALWAQNHLLVLPSRVEGLPLALVEAMWCARPAVVTASGGNAELCQDEKTGFVAAAPNAGLLAQAMERAWDRRHDWQKIGQAARQKVEALVPKNPVERFCGQLMELTKH